MIVFFRLWPVVRQVVLMHSLLVDNEWVRKKIALDILHLQFEF
jgi:hypothetical protein